MKQDADALEALASTLTDSINGYEEAAEVAKNSGISSYLRQKAQERRAIAESFRQRIATMGGDAQVSGSVSAALHRRFLDLRSMFQNDTTAAVAEVEPVASEPRQGFDAEDPSTWGNPGRNDLCPCGSGKKFKHCHGAF